MIKSFADRWTEELFLTGQARKLPPDVAKRAKRKLDAIHASATLINLKFPLANRLHALFGDRDGQYAIAVNLQWRICFRFVDGDAYDVECCDYH